MQSRTTRLLLGAAATLVLVGVGNIAIGRSKANDYVALLSRDSGSAASELPRGQRRRIMNDTYVRRVRSRIDFYEFVELGGKTFMALGGLCLVGALLAMRLQGERPRRLPTEAQNGNNS